MEERHSAGDNIAAWCTKCKLVLDHTIVAMVGGAVGKVQCRTCGSKHKYNDRPGTARSEPSSPKRPAKVSGPSKWEAVLAGATGAALSYAMDGKYGVGDVIDHAKFGKGVVTAVTASRCEVLFKDGPRLMVCGN